MKPLRILVVSYTFPPQAEVGSIRIAQFCRYLPECGIEPTVLSVEEQFYESVDHSRTLPGSLRVLRTPRNSNPLEWYRSLKQIIKASPSRETPIFPAARCGRGVFQWSTMDVSSGRSALKEKVRGGLVSRFQGPLGKRKICAQATCVVASARKPVGKELRSNGGSSAVQHRSSA